jgi:hypothetical protein
VEQQFAAVRVLFDRLITGQVMATNPATAVRGPARRDQGEPRRDRYAPAGQTRVGDELTTLGKA